MAKFTHSEALSLLERKLSEQRTNAESMLDLSAEQFALANQLEDLLYAAQYVAIPDYEDDNPEVLLH